MPYERVTIAGEGEWNVELLGVFDCLLHAVPDSVHVVLGFHNGQRKVVPVGVVKEVVDPLAFFADARLSYNLNTPRREVEELFTGLVERSPGDADRRGDVPSANLGFS